MLTQMKTINRHNHLVTINRQNYIIFIEHAVIVVNVKSSHCVDPVVSGTGRILRNTAAMF